MKYQTELSEIQKLLPNAQNILLALPADADVDTLASGLSLFLSLEQVNKKVSIVTNAVVRVGHTHLFGVGEIQSKLPQAEGGDFIITLGGVATSDGRVPAVERMDYYPEGNDLNLVFKVLPGQKFEPTFIAPKFRGGNFDLIFVLGASSLQSLGPIYNNNPQNFSGIHLVNISHKQETIPFGTTNIIDTQVSSLSEVMMQVLLTLGLPLENDIASNILTGIFDATKNLSGGNVGAETYEVVALALRNGGKKPAFAEAGAESVPAEDMDNLAANTPQQESVTGNTNQGFDLSKIFNAPVNLENMPAKNTGSATIDNFTVPQVISSGVEQKKNTQPISSPEETPLGEGVESVTPEADWLTPKIFKGGKSSLG